MEDLQVPQPVKATVTVEMSDGSAVQWTLNPDGPVGVLTCFVDRKECMARAEPIAFPGQIVRTRGTDTHLRLDLAVSRFAGGGDYAKVQQFEATDPIPAAVLQRVWHQVDPPNCCEYDSPW